MRILQTVFDMMDYGGIVQYTELLTRGLRELGHDVSVIKLRNSDREPYTTRGTSVVQGQYDSLIANTAHVRTGWYGMPVYCYGSKRARRTYRKFADAHDLVIHQIPAPTFRTMAHNPWERVYDLDAPQLVAVHDAHMPLRYPHLLRVAHQIRGIAAVNEAAYNSLAGLPVRRALIGSPQAPYDGRIRPWHKRSDTLASVHVWKKWKRMHHLVRAIPRLPRDIQCILGGDGIERHYMSSTTKCKVEYKGIWRRALKHGMDFRSLMSPDEVRATMLRARVMVDLSYSTFFEPYGNHVNRTTMEAYKYGCVPLLVRENMDERHTRKFFCENTTHLAVSKDATPDELAEAIVGAMSLRRADAERIITCGQSLLDRYWHYRKIATWYLRLATQDTHVGMYGRVRCDQLSSSLSAACERTVARVRSRS